MILTAPLRLEGVPCIGVRGDDADCGLEVNGSLLREGVPKLALDEEERGILLVYASLDVLVLVEVEDDDGPP